MAEWTEERTARLALAAVTEPGRDAVVRLLDHYSAAEVWATLVRRNDSAAARRASTLDVGALVRATERAGARFVTPGDAEWPDALSALGTAGAVHEMSGEPFGLWVAGDGVLGELTPRSVAIVGARAASPYGERIASSLAGGLAAERVRTVSGGAFGIDAAAHRGALAEGGPTVAVLAGGVDVPYPRAHESLLLAVARGGVLVSEYPPGERPMRSRFLARNRLIAAMSLGTVVVEAAARSGACNTAAWALACGRPLMAVPGPATSALSYTPHRMIRDGRAVLVASPEHVLEVVSAIGELPDELETPQARTLDALSIDERAVLDALPVRGGRSADHLLLATGLPVPTVLAALASLTQGGWARALDDGTWGLGPTVDRPVVSAAGG